MSAVANPSSYQTDIGNLLSLGGTGLAAYNQQQQYDTLQNALKTIGPTQLQGFNMGGPGGMSSGYNPQTGQASIDLGSLNPAFSGFAGAAGGGSNAYNAGLPSALSNTALGTLPAALNTLGGAYGNYNAGMGAANSQLGSLGDFNTTYNNMLQAQYGQLAPQIQQQAFGLQNTLFGNGVADSTGAASGSLAAQNFGRGVGQAQSTAQLNAFQQALAQQNSAASNYGTLSAGAGNILSNAFNNFGNTNQLVSGLNTAGLNNATTAAQGAGALNTVGLNNYNAALQTGVGQGTVRNQSLFPYASVAQALAGAPNASSAFANMMTNAGSSLAGNNSGLSSMFQKLFPSTSTSDAGNYGLGSNNGYTGYVPDNSSVASTNLSNYQESVDPNQFNDSGYMDWGNPSAAGGEAANGMTAGIPQYTNNAAVAGYSTTGGAGAGAAAGQGAGGVNPQQALGAASTAYKGYNALAPYLSSASAAAPTAATVSAADWGGAYAGLDASTSAALGADAAGISGAGAGAGTGAAAGAGAGAGGSGSLGALAAAWPVAVGVGGLLGLDAIYNHNSIMSNEAAMGDLSQGLPALNAAAASPQAALARNQGYLAPGMTAADLQQGDASSASLLKWLSDQYANNNMSAEMNTNKLGLSLGKAGQSYSAGSLFNTSRLRQQ